MPSILSCVKRTSHHYGHLGRHSLIEHCRDALLESAERNDEQLVAEAVATSVTAIELRQCLAQVLSVFLPQYGYGHPVVDQAFRLLAETHCLSHHDVPLSHPSGQIGETVLTYPLLYHVIAAPALPFAPERLLVLGDAQDTERGILVVSSAMLADVPQFLAHSPYLPVQAIPPGSITPDVIVEMRDGEEHLTTLHLCTIWRGMRRHANSPCWERVSYQTPQLALQYNQTRAYLCPSCLHVHRGTCLVSAHAEPFQLALAER